MSGMKDKSEILLSVHDLVVEFGRDRANECLKVVARILSPVVTRPADLLAKTDMAEFAAVLPNTDEEGVKHLVREIKESITLSFSQKSDFSLPFVLDVDIGVSTVTPQEIADSELLWAYAEMST